jgi:predicted secreted protein
MVEAGGIEPLLTPKEGVCTPITLLLQKQYRFTASPKNDNALRLGRAQKRRHFPSTTRTLLILRRVQPVCNGGPAIRTFRGTFGG